MTLRIEKKVIVCLDQLGPGMGKAARREQFSAFVAWKRACWQATMIVNCLRIHPKFLCLFHVASAS
jgi:hypothetical protein